MEREDKSITEAMSDLATAIKQLAGQTPFAVEAVKRYNKEFRICILRSMINNLAIFAKEELILFIRLQSASWLTRWYWQKRYRKAKLSRIQLERHIRDFKQKEDLC